MFCILRYMPISMQCGDNLFKNRLQWLENLEVVHSKSVKVTVGVIPAQVPGTTAAATSTRGPASVSATRACSGTWRRSVWGVKMKNWRSRMCKKKVVGKMLRIRRDIEIHKSFLIGSVKQSSSSDPASAWPLIKTVVPSRCCNFSRIILTNIHKKYSCFNEACARCATVSRAQSGTRPPAGVNTRWDLFLTWRRSNI